MFYDINRLGTSSFPIGLFKTERILSLKWKLKTLSRKDSITHMHGLAVYVKEGLPFANELSLENSEDSYLYFRLALLHLLSYFFFVY